MPAVVPAAGAVPPVPPITVPVAPIAEAVPGLPLLPTSIPVPTDLVCVDTAWASKSPTGEVIPTPPVADRRDGE